MSVTDDLENSTYGIDLFDSRTEGVDIGQCLEFGAIWPYSPGLVWVAALARKSRQGKMNFRPAANVLLYLVSEQRPTLLPLVMRATKQHCLLKDCADVVGPSLGLRGLFGWVDGLDPWWSDHPGLRKKHQSEVVTES
jgi:hypothetical protein